MSERKTIFSPDRKYRYVLWREWADDLFQNRTKEGYVMFIGLNPSTADETTDDPTIRKCKGFAKRWGYLAMCMTNLFAYRATKPRDMFAAADDWIPITGADNDKWLREISDGANVVVAAWGTKGHAFYRDDAVMEILGTGVQCLRRTNDGHPEHPLYVPYETQLVDYNE